VPRSRSQRSLTAWPPRPTLLRYGLAIVSVGAALLLMQGLELLSVADARPALLVAVAVSTLYGGLGPGLTALALASVISRDPGVFVAGALLAGVCALFRRPPTTEKPASPVEPERRTIERARAIPPFAEITTEATWRFHHEQPLDITMTEDEQVEHLYLYSVLAECNDAFARMYGFRSAADVIGTRLVVFLPPSNPENIAYLRSFIRSGYRLEDAMSREIDRYGNAKCFVNNLVGIFERGQLVGAWGTQRDVTEEQEAGSSQENRSRIHSSKSSSQ
jgi:hypothetical protein